MEPGFPRGPLPAVRVGHRLLGAGRGDPRRVRRCGDTDHVRRGLDGSSPTAWRSCLSTARRARGAGQPPRHAVARLLGVGRATRRGNWPRTTTPERMREGYFSAVRADGGGDGRRSPAGAGLRGHPLGRPGHARPDRVHRRRWVRGPLLLLCLTRDELFERRPQLGLRAAATPPRSCSTRSTARRRAALVSALLGNADFATSAMAPLIAERAGGNPLFAEELVRRPRRGRTSRSPTCRTRCGPCSPLASTRSRPTSGGCSSRPP